MSFCKSYQNINIVSILFNILRAEISLNEKYNNPGFVLIKPNVQQLNPCNSKNILKNQSIQTTVTLDQIYSKLLKFYRISFVRRENKFNKNLMIN